VGKRILLCAGGGIAVYKTVELLRLLQKEEALVRAAMTRNAARFVTPLTFEALTGEPVYADMFADTGGDAIRHITWADWAEAVVVAPCTANLAAKLACGIADDAVSTLLLATRAPVLLCPSMNVNMFRHPATQENLERLARRGVAVMSPGQGFLACGWSGEGRLPEPLEIADRLKKLVSPRDFAGKTVLVTAGPTHEAIDPVRFVTNPSTGKMGYAVARAAEHRGARVILVSGPASLPEPLGVATVRVKSALEMRDAVLALADEADIVIKSAAVSDYRPENPAEHKIKKTEGGVLLEMVRNPDILLELGKRKRSGQVLVGFAAETQNLEAYAREKLEKKNLDLIVANLVGKPDSGFGTETNRVVFLYKEKPPETLDLMSKEAAAHALLDRVLAAGRA
jgi:phosphopantothenoylcysteine decarboxylase/phosphopantothenate--cysteine ligase